jgi:4-hydroxy-3-methylbut-2-enyl diphosphate reductase
MSAPALLRAEPNGAAGGGLLALASGRMDVGAVRAGAPRAVILRAGPGPRRARAAAGRARALEGVAVAAAGIASPLAPDVQPGDLVVATEVRGPAGIVLCPGAEILAGALRRRGVPARCGPILSVPPGARASVRADGALALDRESAWLAVGAADRPLAVVRAIVAGEPRTRPGASTRAWRTLTRAGGVLAEWAAAVRPRRVVLGSPRASCAGVERAIEVVERALERHGTPVYVRKQIVHNRHVVADLERRGAVFVDELDEVPEGATLVFSAHGVSPVVRAAAAGRDLRVIDATCPLVNKVHVEARRFADAGYTVLLIGHEGHDEVAGTVGEAPDAIRLVEDLDEAGAVEVEDPDRVAYLTQTTLAVDETAEVVDVLRERFPTLAGPRTDDICYATQNRQDAVRALARECDALLVVGSANSSNSTRMVEVSEREGCPARLIDDAGDVDLAWLRDVGTLGLTAGASAPERVVLGVLRALRGLGPLAVEEQTVATESVRFGLPGELR